MNKPDAPILVTFALPDESRDLVRLLSHPVRLAPRDHLSPVAGRLSGQPIVILHTGVGHSAACQRRLRAFLETASPRLAISAGYAGGLAPALRVGDLLLGENHSDPALLATARSTLHADPPHVGALLTQPTAAETVAAKSTLHAETSALAVDMETAWIAAVCAEHRLPLLSLRVISDAADQPFPVPGHVLFDAARQRPRYFALPLHLLVHPTRILPFIRFVEALPAARACLTRALVLHVESLTSS